jgi:hypothetical protein
MAVGNSPLGRAPNHPEMGPIGIPKRETLNSEGKQSTAFVRGTGSWLQLILGQREKTVIFCLGAL